jgi:CS domain
VAAAPEKKVEAPKKPPSEAVAEMEQISTYNGAKTERYNWSQTVQEVMVQLPLPEGTVSKQMDIKMQSKAISVALKGSKDGPLLKGDLSEKIKVDDSFWTIEDRKYLVLHLQKAYEAIWKCVLVGDAEIDPKTVDNSKRVDEFDLETQGHLQKVLYEQERKKRGLLTTEEEEQRKLMEKVMGA